VVSTDAVDGARTMTPTFAVSGGEGSARDVTYDHGA
jgi:hypothetical protein